MTQTTLKVEGMSCGHCAKSVEGALSAIGAKGTVDLNAKTVTVQYDESKLDQTALKAAIEDQGYDVV
ncbi:MAG: copper resistance protein CopZ [Paenibacillaceae bacterium]|jgi:copper chaperone|nr:copper resistance protein CopZ [Paenibacillaceae bacterium]